MLQHVALDEQLRALGQPVRNPRVMELTLLGFDSKRWMKIVDDFVEHLCFHILFGIGIHRNNFHGPMAEWKAFDATVCAFSIRRNDRSLAKFLAF
jgi:hypothetical protein